MHPVARALLLVVCAFAASALVGCEHAGRLLVVVGTDYEVPDEATFARVVIAGPDDLPHPYVYALRSIAPVAAEPSAIEVPFSFIVRPLGGDASRRVDIGVSLHTTRADAESGASPVGRPTTRHVSGFVRNETRILAIHVSRACAVVNGCGTYCEYGICSPSAVIDPKDLAIGHNGGEELHVFEDAQAPTMDAGVAVDASASSPDGGPYSPAPIFSATGFLAVADANDGIGFFFAKMPAAGAHTFGRRRLPGATAAGYDQEWPLPSGLEVRALAASPTASATEPRLMLLVHDTAAVSRDFVRVVNAADGTEVHSSSTTLNAPYSYSALSWGQDYAVVATERSLFTVQAGIREELALEVRTVDGIANAVWAGALRSASGGAVSIGLLNQSNGTLLLVGYDHGARTRSDSLIPGGSRLEANDACLAGDREPAGLWIVARSGSDQGVIVHRFASNRVATSTLGDLRTPLTDRTQIVPTLVRCGRTDGTTTHLLVGGTLSGPNFSLFGQTLPRGDGDGIWFAEITCTAAEAALEITCNYVPGTSLTFVGDPSLGTAHQIAVIQGRPYAIVGLGGAGYVARDDGTAPVRVEAVTSSQSMVPLPPPR